ncbi:MAG: hypothetical protein KIT09_20010 [Bryobacteraceae bacterium]|nr:hypothetical protein [Bryobacteraceae bacterium]
MRDLTRMRAHAQQDRNPVINRIARLLETLAFTRETRNFTGPIRHLSRSQ